MKISEIIEIYTRKHILAIMCLGFISGFPFLLLTSTLSIWLKDIDCKLEIIGCMFLITLPYGLKFLWAPIIDQCSIPLLTRKMGQRRSWALVTQITLFVSLLSLANSNPENNIYATAVAAFIVSFCAASQDMVVDAYRVERLSKQELGIGTSLFGTGFRLGMLASGAGSIYLSEIYDWSLVYLISSFVILIGPFIIMLINEPAAQEKSQEITELYQAEIAGIICYLKYVFRSFVNITRHNSWLYIVLFIFLFKISDVIPNSMNAIFLLDTGFSKMELGNAKFIGLTMMSLGNIVGGIITAKYNMRKAILLGGLIQFTSPLMFVYMSIIEHDHIMLLVSQSIQSFACGIGAAIFYTFLSSLCYGGFTATQLSVLHSISSISRVILSFGSTIILSYLHLSWSVFFVSISIISLLFIIPVMMFSKEKSIA